MAGDLTNGGVRIAHGARATEAALLAEVGEFASAVRSDPGLLAKPLRIVVPSRSLREHLAARLVRSHGRSVAGISIQTLRGLAFELLRRAGEPAPGGDVVFPILVRQAARREPALRDALDSLEDGYGVVAASISDLLDAGFEEAHAEAIDEWMEVQLGGRVAARGRAILRVAAQVSRVLESHGLEHRSGLFRRAREVLERHPLEALPAHRILIHGYADATGVQLDLIAALVRYRGALALVDRPDDPAEPGQPDPGVAFSGRFVGRLAQFARVVEAPRRASPPEIRMFRAPGAHAEVRAVAERVAALLEAGAIPEEIAVVARDLSPFATPIRTHFERLGIPFSAAAEVGGPLLPAGRRLRALLGLLRQREMTGSDRWLDASDWVAPSLRRELQLAMHAIGVARLRDVARLPLPELLGEREAYALPLRHGLGGAPSPDAAPVRARHRVVSRELLERAVRQARSLVRRFADWPPAEGLAAHVGRLRALLAEDLGWRAASVGFEDLDRRLSELMAELGPDVSLGLEEFVLLCQRTLDGLGRSRLGGQGGGVQVLRVVDARARTFDHLFLLGMNRDLFPRAISEDPLLPDAVRAALEREVLPDIPIKRRGFDEERYLFAELLSASPHVTLSWQEVSDDGKQKTPSPLVERMRLSGDDTSIRLVPALFDALPADRVRPAHEHAVLAGLSGARLRFGRVLPLALAETRELAALPCDAPSLVPLADGRLAVLAELDARGSRRDELGPYYGFLGPLAGDGDARSPEPYVTTLESLARCPWQTLLERLLRLEPLPDARLALPEINRLLIGNLLHRLLERIARDAGVPSGGSVASLAERAGCAVPWPARERIDAILADTAASVTREAGIALPGFPRLLAERALPFVERVRALDFSEAGALQAVLGVEVEGCVSIQLEDAGERVLRFRADRVDRLEGVLRLTDYKAGSPVSEAKKPDTRRARFMTEVGAGVRLQVPAYSLYADAAAGSSGRTLGRYLFARPDLPDASAVQEAGSDDDEVRERFLGALGTLFGVWEAGSFFPRLLDADGRSEPDQCERCLVAEACLRGDSGARARLLRWLERRPERESDPASVHRRAEAALRAGWRMAEGAP